MRKRKTSNPDILAVATLALALAGQCRLAASPAEATNAPPAAPASERGLKLPENPTAIPEPVPGSATRAMGDLVLVGQNATVAQGETVTGDAVVVAGDLTIHGKITGEAVCVGGKLTVGPTAEVGGDLVTVGSVARIDPAAKIAGSKVNVASFSFDLLKRLGPIRGDAAQPQDPVKQARRKAVIFFVLEILFFAALAFLGLLMTTFLPAQFARVTEHIEGDFGRSALLGFLLMFLLPLGVVILVLTLAITVFGLPLVPLVPLAAALGLFAGYVILGHAIGRRCFGSRHPLLQTVLGIALLQAPAILGDAIGLALGFNARIVVVLGAFGMMVCIAGSFIGLGAIFASRFGGRSLAQTVATRQVNTFPPPAAA